MNNNNELDNLVESFLNPKPQPKAMDLNELFALFKQMESLKEIQTGAFLPTVSAQQKQYEPEAQQQTAFYEVLQDILSTQVLSSTQGQEAPERIRQLIAVVRQIKTADLSKSKKASLSKVFSTILFVSSLHKMIEDIVPDLPSTAGFFFEKFIGFLLKGKVQTTDEDDKFAIYDIVIDDPQQYVSMKLLKDFGIEGSIYNMYKYFASLQEKNRQPINIDENFNAYKLVEENATDTQQSSITKKVLIPNDKNIIYIVAVKRQHALKFYSYKFNLAQFLQMLGKDKIKAYNDSLRSSNAKVSIKGEIDDLTTQIRNAEYQGDQEKVQKLQNQQRELLFQLNAISSKDVTKFNLTQAALKAVGAENLMKGEGVEDVLSLSPEEKDKIIEQNRSLFEQDIKEIIEESNLVYYKVNNFILSDKGDATDAYNSVKILEQHLSKYTKPASNP